MIELTNSTGPTQTTTYWVGSADGRYLLRGPFQTPEEAREAREQIQAEHPEAKLEKRIAFD